MNTGFMYWFPGFYQHIVHSVYGPDFYSRYNAISDLLPDKTSVVDVCCGDCYLYNFLKGKHIDYLGLDLNLKFIKYAKKNGIHAELLTLIMRKFPRRIIL